MTFQNLDIPVLQAPIGSAGSTTLAAAVSNAGGMGSLALTWDTPESAAAKIRGLKAQTDRTFFVNYVLTFPPHSLDAALEAGAPAVTFSWGQPGDLVDKARRGGAKIGVQVGTVDGARQAMDSQPDFIICQGVEAGGHVQSTLPLQELVSQVLDIAGEMPVIVAGGLTGGGDLFRALQQGCAGIMLGTRFVATLESDAHPRYKQAIVDAGTGDSVYTLCFDGGWPYAAHRVLRNGTLNAWESAGCPPVGRRPNENEIVVHETDGPGLRRYDDSPPLAGMHGDILESCLYAGTGCGLIEDIPGAEELLSRIRADFDALSRANGR